MEQWEQEYIAKFKGQVDARKVKRFFDNVLKKERKRDVMSEVLDYVKRHNSKTDQLVNYIYNRNSCDRYDPSQKLLDELGIEIHEPEARILAILERYFNPPEVKVTLLDESKTRG